MRSVSRTMLGGWLLLVGGCSLEGLSDGRPLDASDGDANDRPPENEGGSGPDAGDPDAPPCPGCEVLASNEPQPTEILVAEGRLAWLRRGTGYVVRSELDGRSPAVDTSGPSIVGPHDLVAVRDYFFVLSADGTMTRRHDYSSCTDATGITRLASFGAELLLAKGSALSWRMRRRHVLVTESVRAVAGDPPYAWYARANGDIVRCDAAANQCAAARSVLASSQGDVTVIAHDATRVYWVTPGTASELRTRPKNAAGLAGEPTRIATGEPKAIAPGGDYLYWTDLAAGEIRRAPITGGGPSTVVAYGLAQPWGLALTPTHLYFTESGADRVQRMPLPRGP